MTPTAPVFSESRWRRALAISLAVSMAVTGLPLVVAGLLVERSEQHMIHDLKTHGVRESGLAVDDFNDRVHDAQVRFSVGDGIQVRALQVQDTVLQTPKEGDLVPIVYDANDPSRVMLVSQLTGQHRAWNYGAAGVGALLTVGALLVWRKRPQQQAPVAAPSGTREPYTPANDLRVGPNGELPRQRRR